MFQDKIPNFRNEGQLEKYSVAWAETQGIKCYKWVSPGNRGVPDQILIFPGGETIFVEFKRPDGTGKLSALQIERATEIKEQGASVYECDNFGDFSEIISRHLERVRVRSQ